MTNLMMAILKNKYMTFVVVLLLSFVGYGGGIWLMTQSKIVMAICIISGVIVLWIQLNGLFKALQLHMLKLIPMHLFTAAITIATINVALKATTEVIVIYSAVVAVIYATASVIYRNKIIGYYDL